MKHVPLFHTALPFTVQVPLDYTITPTRCTACVDCNAGPLATSAMTRNIISIMATKTFMTYEHCDVYTERKTSGKLSLSKRHC